MSIFCYIQVVALDPGVRCFQTAYSPNGESAAYCQSRNGYNIVFSLAERVDKIASTLDEDKKAKHKLLTPRKSSHLKKEINRLRQRSQNLVTEVRGLLKQGKKERKRDFMSICLLCSLPQPTPLATNFHFIVSCNSCTERWRTTSARTSPPSYCRLLRRVRW